MTTKKLFGAAPGAVLPIEGQELAAKNFYRPRNSEVLAQHLDIFKPLVLVSIADAFGDWKDVQKIHFDNGGIFDQFKLQPKKE